MTVVLAAHDSTALAAETARVTSSSLTVDLDQAAAEPRAGWPENDWWAQLDLSIWLPGISGTIGARGVTADVDVSFSDVLQDSDSVIGLAGAFLFGSGRLGGYVDGFWSKIGMDTTTPLGIAHAKTDMGILDFGVSYEVGRWPMGWTAEKDKPARDLTLVAYGGARYTSVDIDIEPQVFASRSKGEGWVDPMIGARMELPLAQQWSIGFRGDIGGFGAASDLAWTAAGVVTWDFLMGTLPSSLQFGYIAVGDDYSNGSGTDRFVWDTILHGFVLNFQMSF